MFKSRIVNKSGYYEIEVNSSGIHLTEITNDELSEIPFTHWIYMDKGESLEGTSLKDIRKVPSTNILESFNTHNHLFEQYIGFNEVYKHCVICGVKE